MTTRQSEPNICRSVVPHKDATGTAADDNDTDPNSTVAIKSQTVVKLQTFQSPASFARLQCNTDLKTPPSNWLTNSANTYGLQQALSHSTGFTSFRMAHMFPDCLGEIDVVSSAENIKKLLKLPYSAKSGISLMIHRIENTLLIDDFDIHKYLLRQADDDWQWLKSFMCEHILAGLGDTERRLFVKNKSREALQQRSLQSKFLYHSLTAGEQQQQQHQQLTKRAELTLTGPLLPDPSVDENVPDPHSNHTFNRNVVWTFEDIRMLIGTDMPIFGSAHRPCISLRLRDMNQPINVLTGIDYWLDNLMCNVPEVVMCYHLDGLVQKYELIPTEDLPNLENSKFSPKVIRNVAQNILAFLKQNATKAGHTYWLFKGRNDDFVKLYDLTSLCMNADEATKEAQATDGGGGGAQKEKANEGAGNSEQGKSTSAPTGDGSPSTPNDENPFTVPVAMLLYKVARNMKNMAQDSMSAKQAGSIKTLLDNCIQLLPKEKYPQIVTSSHYILSDLHVPAGIDPNAPNFSWSPDEEGDGDASDEVDDQSDAQSQCTDAPSDDGCSTTTNTTGNESVATKNIRDTLHEFHLQPNWKHNASPPPIVGDAGQRCDVALAHIVEGLGCLQYFSQTAEKLSQAKAEERRAEERRRIRDEEQNPTMANARQAIPLPYASLRTEAPCVDAGEAIPLGWIPEEAKKSTMTTTTSAGKKSKKQRRKSENRQAVVSSAAAAAAQLATPGEETATTTTTTEAAPPRSLLLHGRSGVIESWHVHLKLLLLEKACLTYATLAEQAYTAQRYGDSLRYIQLAMQCQLIVTKYVSSVSSQKLGLLGRAGDCYFQLAKAAAGSDDGLARNQREYAAGRPVDETMRAELAKDLAGVADGAEMAALLPEPSGSVEVLMVRSCACYERALRGEVSVDAAEAEAMRRAAAQARREFVGRLGSVRNELGIKYMHWAQQEYARFVEQRGENDTIEDTGGEKKAKEEEPLYQVFIRKSYDCLLRGIGAFEEIADSANLAILMCNMGRFMRFRAHVVMIGESTADIALKRKFYQGAFTSYQRALGFLETRKRNPVLWDLVNWELSTGTFTLAQHVLDNTASAEQWTDGAEHEIIELLLAALKLCDTETAGERQVLYALRQGLVYHRLADVYARSYRRCCGATTAAAAATASLGAGDESGGSGGAGRKKQLLQLGRMYYEKAARSLEPLEQTVEFVQVLRDRLSLQEYLANAATTNNAKIRQLQQSLDILRQSGAVLRTAAEASSSPDAQLDELLDEIVRQLQTVLRTLIKLCMGQQQQQRTADRPEMEAYKKLYSLTLRRGSANAPSASSVVVLCHLLDAMTAA